MSELGRRGDQPPEPDGSDRPNDPEPRGRDERLAEAIAWRKQLLEPRARPEPRTADRLVKPDDPTTRPRPGVEKLAPPPRENVRLPEELGNLRPADDQGARAEQAERGPVDAARSWMKKLEERRADSADRPQVCEVDRPESIDIYDDDFKPNHYEQVLGDKPLFDGEPRREDVRQGALGDCGVLATLGAVAGTDPEKIRDAVRDNGDGSYTVELHDTTSAWPDGSCQATGEKTTLTVSSELPVEDEKPGRPAFAMANEAAWPAIMEKAISGSDVAWGPAERGAWEERWAGQKDVLNEQRAAEGKPPLPDGPTPSGYARLNQGSDAYDRAELLTRLTGRPAEVRSVPDDPGQLLDDFRHQLAFDKPILIGTRPLRDDERMLPHRLHHAHAYEVTGVGYDGRIRMRNPWGNRHPDPLTPQQFKNYFRDRYSTLG